MTKHIGYKQQIEQELLKNNWEVLEIVENSTWWNDEYWEVKTRFPTFISLFISFIVDSQFDYSRKKGQGITAITASTKLPHYWNDGEGQISQINMEKGRFDIKLVQFISEIESFKKEYKN